MENNNLNAAETKNTVTQTEETTVGSPQNKKAEKNYKTAFLLMTVITICIFIVFVGSKYIQHASVKKTEFYESVLSDSTDPAEVPDRQLPETDIDIINVNTATVAELTKLPGIGESKATEIVNYRNEYGRFTSAEDLLNVNGIGKTLLEKIRLYITTESQP